MVKSAYNKIMQQKPNFDRIKDFVKDNSRDTIVIRKADGGFRANGYFIRQEDDRWNILDKEGTSLARFFNRKIAILSAIMISKNKSTENAQLQQLDRQLAVASEDHRYFQHLTKNRDEGSAVTVYSARLDRAKQVMEEVKHHIITMEKSLGLQ